MLLVRPVSDVYELYHAVAAGARDVQLAAGVYDFTGISRTLKLDDSIRIRGAADGGTILTNYERKAPLFYVGDATMVTIEDLTCTEGGILVRIDNNGPDTIVELKRLQVQGTGPAIVTHGAPDDRMRDVSINIEDCRIDCGYQAKAIALGAVGVAKFTMARTHITRCEKAAVQIGEGGDDMYQARRRNITIRDSLIEGVVDRENEPGESHALFLRSCRDILLENNRIREVNSRVGRNLDTEAIYTKAMNVEIRGCWVHNGGRAGITVKGVAYQPGITDPVHYRCGDNIVIENCSITASLDHAKVGLTEGILLDCGGNVIVRSTLISGVQTGIRVSQGYTTGDYTIVDNQISAADIGIYYREVGGKVDVARNLIRNSTRAQGGPDIAKANLLGSLPIK